MPSMPASLPPGIWTVLGLMSGTSADGTDAAAIRVDAEAFAQGDPFLECLGHHHLPYPADLRAKVLAEPPDHFL